MKFLFLINGVPVTDKNGKELQLTFELQSVKEQMEQVVNPVKDAPTPLDDTASVLLSAEAQPLWEKAKKKGWVDDDLMPLMSQGKAAILASVIADKLDISPRWAPFESLWHQSSLTKRFCQAQLCKYYSSVYKEFYSALM